MASFTVASIHVFVLHLSLISITLSFLFHPYVAVDLNLQSKTHCTFHMVSSYGTDLSERILNSNQYGQPWTVRNISEPMLKPVADDENLHHVRLYDWESRFCNVHLIIDSDSPFKGVGVWNYGDRPSVRDPHSAFVVWVLLLPTPTVEAFTFTRPANYLTYNLQHYVIGVHDSLQIGGVRGQNFDKHHGNRGFGGESATVVHPYGVPSQLKSECSTEGHLFEKEKLACLTSLSASVWVPQFLVQRMNGSVRAVRSIPRKELTFIVGEVNWSKFLVRKHRAERYLLTEDQGLFILYCDYEKKRIRNNYNWLNTFGSTYWGLVLATCVLAILLSNVQMINNELKFDSDLFNSFSLIKGEGSIRSGLHFAIMLGGCVIMVYYENHMTSIALVPDQPMIYPTVKELMQAGYKIKTTLSEDAARREVSMMLTSKFNNETKQLLYDGFHVCRSGEEYQNATFEPTQRFAVHVGGPHRALVRKDAELLNPSAMCHYVPEPFEDNRRLWMLFSGFLSDELASHAQLLLESGLRAFWIRVEQMMQVSPAKLTNKTAIATATRSGPTPISMDFEIMRIFPICGCFLLVTFAVFLAECACHHGKEPTKRACREIKGAGNRARAWARAAWKIARIRGRIRNWLRKI